MALRGRGRGRGHGGTFGGFAKQEPFILFPENVELPKFKEEAMDNVLLGFDEHMRRFWKSSAYYIGEKASADSKGIDIERYSNRSKKIIQERPPLSDFLELTPANFPRELIQGSKKMPNANKKVRWNQESDQKKLDELEKRDEKYEDKDGEKEKEEEEEEEEEEGELEDEEYSSNDDYDMNKEFDDDDLDDGDDDGEEEPTYD